MDSTQHPAFVPEFSSSTRILVVDSHPIVLRGLRCLLTEEAGYNVVSEVKSSDKIIDALKEHQPEIVLMDIHFLNVDGLELVKNMLSSGVTTKIVVLTDTLTEEETCSLISNGVKGILLKEMPTKLILDCLQRVLNGGEWLERRSMMLAFEQVLRQATERQKVSNSLSPRELELATLIATGCSNKVASQKLFLSEGSVRVYLSRIYEKLDVSNRFQLALYFQQKELV